MNFKSIFDRAIPLDATIKEEIENSLLSEGKIKKALNIFYKVDLELIKPEEKKPEQPQPATQQQPVATNPAAPQQEVNAQPAPETPAPAADTNVQQAQEPAAQNPEGTENQEQEPVAKPDLSNALASVVTEEVIINDKNKIIRKSERKIPINTDQANNIQSIDDIISTISKVKKSGVKVFDDFVGEIMTLCVNQNFNEIKTKLDKKSKIFFEIYYGKTKDDSVGVRINKRANSDTMTSTMLLDNEIISAKFDIEKINQKIIEYRNYEVKKA